MDSITTDIIRFPTEADFGSQRTFCIINLSFSSKELGIEVRTRNAKITEDSRKGVWLGPLWFGTKTSLAQYKLGVFHGTSRSEFSGAGRMVDYSENEAALIEAARSVLEKLRMENLANLRKLVEDYQSAPFKLEAN